jgi:RsiW-degrading membrane proteinase PrsW (M82 family)
MLGLAIILSLVPVVAFLCALRTLDTYKLLSFRRIVIAIFAGSCTALAAFPINTFLFQWLGTGPGQWIGPVIEELLKAIFPLWSIRARRVGFPVDAGIVGFATGAGFSLVENIVYISSIPDSTPVLWLLRGLGTAVMHGTTTAIVAILAVTVQDYRSEGSSNGGWRATAAAVCGLLLALAIHLLHNSSLLNPTEMAAAMLIGAPALLAGIFWKSEQMLARWLAAKLGQDIEIIAMIDSGAFLESKAGRYLQSLAESFPPEVVGDMLCLIRLSAGLSAQAKGDLLRREMGFEPEHDPDLASKLQEMAYLEKSVGRAGRLALAPLAPRQVRDVWEMHRLRES